MIRIHKSPSAPEILNTKGAEANFELCALVDADPDNYRSSPPKPSKAVGRLLFDPAIYGHREVKEQLKKDQFGKCCFCEGKFEAFSAGDVEHFRPKAALLKEGDTTPTLPGYYWLAYDWNNLLFSCERCNRSHKRNSFPLENEALRVSSHLQADQLDREKPLLINPTLEDPEEHITFEGEVPKPKNGSHRGELSIECYGLDRKELCDARHRYLKRIKLLWEILEAGGGDSAKRKEIEQVLFEARSPESQFSAMIRANFPEPLE